MLHHFVYSIDSGDYEAAADDVAGADNDPWVRSLKDSTRIRMDAVQWASARTASVWVETRMDETYYSLQKQNGKWKVVNMMTVWTRPPTFRSKATPQVLAPGI